MSLSAALRFHIKTFGCRLNQAESDNFTAQLEAYGWQAVSRDRDADVTIIHSCAITRAAEQEGIRLCRRLTRLQPPPFIVFSGCVTEAAAADALREAGAALVIQRNERDDLAAMVVQACAGQQPRVRQAPLPRTRRTRPLLRVQDGCDFFCTYCIVPHTRGGPVSRPFSQCLDEAKAMIDGGALEIVITGCNTARYRDSSRRLPDLVHAIASLPGLCRLRLSSIEPGTVEREIVNLMAELPTICRHLHLPLQSGDDAILRMMGRRYSSAIFRDSAEYAFDFLPDLGLGTDIITGFPGESDAHFANTLALVKDLPFSNLHVFPYSERQGTPAAHRTGQIAPEIRRQRANTLIAMGDEKRREFARSFIGSPVTTIIESCDARGTGKGWSGAYLPCRVSGLTTAAINTIVAFTPTAADDDTLIGPAHT